MLGLVLALTLGASAPVSASAVAAPAPVQATPAPDALATGGPIDAFLALCPTAGDDWQRTIRQAGTLGWARQDALSGQTPIGSADVYLRGGRTDLLEFATFDGQPDETSPLTIAIPPSPGGGGGRGAAMAARYTASAADAKVEEAVARAGRFRPRIGVAEKSCAIVTDAPAEAMIPALTRAFGGEPGVIEETGTRVWLFGMSGETRTLRPMPTPSAAAVQVAAAWFGPAASASVMDVMIDGRPRRVLRFTRYHALPHAEDVAETGPIQVFLNACLETGADFGEARAVVPWDRRTTASNPGAEIYGGTDAQLELLSAFAEPTQRACRVRFRGHGYETLMEELTARLGPPYMTDIGLGWIYVGDPEAVSLLKPAGAVRFSDVLPDWLDIYGQVFRLTVMGGDRSMVQLNAYRR